MTEGRTRYIIMANGKGKRWGNYQGIPKHLIEVGGETLLQRIVRLVRQRDPEADVVISSSNPLCIAEGARRHSPKHGDLEIDRFCVELIEDGCCFLYGDAFYTKEALDAIMQKPVLDVAFFGTEKGIVAVKVGDAAMMLEAIDALKTKISSGVIEDAKGWTLHHYLEGMPLAGKEMGKAFVQIEDGTTDFNTPREWEEFKCASCDGCL